MTDKLTAERLRALIQEAEDELLQWQVGGQIDLNCRHIGNFNDFAWNHRAAILAMAEERDRLAHDLTVTGEQYATVCAENARMREALEPLANRNDSIGDDARRALGKDQAS